MVTNVSTFGLKLYNIENLITIDRDSRSGALALVPGTLKHQHYYSGARSRGICPAALVTLVIMRGSLNYNVRNGRKWPPRLAGI